MKQLSGIITFLFCLFLVWSARAEIVVVVNVENPVESFSHRELVDLYMGRSQHFPDGSLVLRLDQQPDSEIRNEFYRTLVNKSVGEVNAYWARLLFTGRATPPQPVNGSKSVLEAVRNNRNAIGYVESDQVTENVKVVGRIN